MINKHQQPLFLVGYNYDYVDASDFMDLFVTGGRHAWSYKPYDQTVAAADHSFDAKQRAALYEKAQHILADQAPASFLYVPVNSYLWNPKFAHPFTLPSRSLASRWARSAAIVASGSFTQRSSPSLHRSMRPPPSDQVRATCTRSRAQSMS